MSSGTISTILETKLKKITRLIHSWWKRLPCRMLTQMQKRRAVVAALIALQETISKCKARRNNLQLPTINHVTVDHWPIVVLWNLCTHFSTFSIVATWSNTICIYSESFGHKKVLCAHVLCAEVHCTSRGRRPGSVSQCLTWFDKITSRWVSLIQIYMLW